MNNHTRQLRAVKVTAIAPTKTRRTVMTADGPEPIECAAKMLHVAMTFNLKRYFGAEINKNEYPWATLTWREITTNPDHKWIYELFLRTAEDFAAYLENG